jgi:putative transposase
MPWQETSPVEERSRFIDAYLTGCFDMTELCAQAGISRRVGYKWVARYDQDGRAGLRDRSRAPHSCPHRMSSDLAELLCAARTTHPDWGPKKLLEWLGPRYPRIHNWPAISSVSDLLGRRGLVLPRRRRRRTSSAGTSVAPPREPNALWTADFKGQFQTGDGQYCFPLTVADLASRYLLACHGLSSTQARGARPVFERLFRDCGLPRAIRTDNGAPFVTRGPHGLSALNIWWLRLGIQHQRIRPASPQENGAHERMHRTLKHGAIRPPRATMAAQQRAFNRFRALYNTERPHDALAGATPASHYTPSPRPYPSRLPPIEYPGHFLVRTVSSGGTFSFLDRVHFLTKGIVSHPIGLEETDDGLWSVYFCQLLLARIDHRTKRIIRL